MPMSDLLLQIVAVRLGALVVAGLLLQALPERRMEPACMPLVSVQQHAASAPDPALRADHAARLHD